MKEFLTILLLALLVGCTSNPKQSEELTSFIPDDSMLILKLQNPDLFLSNLRNTEFLSNNKSHPLVQAIEKNFTLFDYFPHKEPALLTLTYSENNDLEYTFITRGSIDLNTDSVQNKKVETITSSRNQIKKYTFDSGIGYLSHRDSISVFSNSKRLLESSLLKEKSLTTSEDFQKAMKASSDKQPTLFLNHKKLSGLLDTWFPGGNKELLEKFGSWTELDADITHSGIKLNGVTTIKDSLDNYLSLFHGVGVADNLIGEITPSNANGLYSLSFERFSQLHQNIEHYKGRQMPETATHQQKLLETASEAGIIYFPAGQVMAIRTLDPEAARFSLSAYQEETEVYRDVPIYAYSREEKFSILEPLLPQASYSFFTYLQDFILFAPEADLLKQIIRASQNKQVIKLDKSYETSFQSLSTESSILLLVNTSQFKKNLSTELASHLPPSAAEVSLKDFPIAAVQLVYQDGFAHTHAILHKSNVVNDKQVISQTASINLGAPLAIPPVFFKNHRTNGLDIAVQDTDNMLYLISPSGKIYWKKQLEARIVGNIHSVDILRNGRYQLAFTTQNQLHVIDRTGKPVNPFPLDFRDEITQPLAVFDYDNKRNYRFVIVQQEELYMFDNKGKRVRGFTFSKAANEIVKQPKHIRIGRKDYILISEDSGKLQILSRTGKTRIPFKEKINFSENNWYEHKGHFTSANSSGEIVQINEKGKVHLKSTGSSNNLFIEASEKLMVTLSENVLRINDKEINLDFGLYTPPKIFVANNQQYIGLTDLQAHKIYLFDPNGNLLPGFPVYGSSIFDLGNSDSDAQLEVTVQGEKESILIYEVQKGQ